MELIDVRGMSVNEYCNFVESRALHLGVSSFELNIQLWERDLISMCKYDLAKAELLSRVACEALERDRPERG
jgi:hypothetical protein